MAWPQSYRSATSVQIHFFQFFVNFFSLLWNSDSLLVFTLFTNEIPQISKYTYENGVTWQNSGFFILSKSYFEWNWFCEIDFMKLIWLKLSLK
jgi:hypothetical protein